LGDNIDSGNHLSQNEISVVLQLRISLDRPGFVKFTYKVSAEERFDGLIVGIDDLRKMFVSNANWTTANFSLSAGYHVIKWIYYKDYSETQGDDRAWIKSIQVTGLSRGQMSCYPCGPGQYSASAGQSSCSLCDANTHSNQEMGSTGCVACTANQYSPPGSATCIERVDCTSIDYTYYHTPA